MHSVYIIQYKCLYVIVRQCNDIIRVSPFNDMIVWQSTNAMISYIGTYVKKNPIYHCLTKKKKNTSNRCRGKVLFYFSYLRSIPILLMSFREIRIVQAKRFNNFSFSLSLLTTAQILIRSAQKQPKHIIQRLVFSQ